jgi:hypothetical protein
MPSQHFGVLSSHNRGAGHSFDFVPEDSATIDAETRTKEFFDKLLR